MVKLGKYKGSGKIDIVDRVSVIGIEKAKGLSGIHNFSGADWGGKFVGISKETWMKASMKMMK